MAAVDPAVFEKLEEFFFADAFVDSFERWALPHVEHFGEAVTTEGEQKLEHTVIFQEFVAMYEGKLAEFVASQDISMPVFMEACKAELLKGEGSNDWSQRSPAAFILNIIAATAEYELFVIMMAEVAQRAKPEKEEEEAQ